MDIRTFRAATLQEALEQVRETLGPNAAVLHTRQVKRSRMGLFSSNLIEVEASVEMPVAGRFVKRAKPDLPDPVAAQSAVQNVALAEPVSTIPSSTSSVVTSDSSSSIVEVDQSNDVENNSTVTTVDNSVSEKNHRVVLESRTKREAVDGTTSRFPPAMYETLSEMLDAGVEPGEAKSLLQTATTMLDVEQLNDALLLQGRICQLVGKSLNVAEPIALQLDRQAVIAMVGPTGVGKTTTLAKLATSFQLERSCQVGLITMDTFRPGAVDQLLQYAESLDAALEVVSSAHQFLPALHRLRNCEIVFIDTAGRSPNDREQIAVLKDLLVAAEPTSVQLVVSATSSMGHVQAAIEQFSPLNPTGLVITKLDEAIGFGAWLSILQNSELPVSYLTHGQHVPRDFSAANRRRLASLLLGHANQPVA